MRCERVSIGILKAEGVMYVGTAFDAEFDTAVETISGASGIIEILIVPAESEPGCSIASPGSRFKVAKGRSGVGAEVIGVGTGSSD